MRRAIAIVVLLCAPVHALNKQGARSSSTKDVVNLSGYLFGGGFVFNPSYAARPNNSGHAALRFGLHLDLDLYRQWLTLSYDENTFTDGGSSSRGIFLPSEHDHILGLVSTIPLPRHLTLTLAVHYELDAPGFEVNPTYRAAHPEYVAGYSQSYVDAYGRLTWEQPRFLLAAALGGFLYNESYAARADNAGIALLRYVLHGELRALPWLTLRLDLNSFTDRDGFPLTPTELDVTSEVGLLRWRAWELRLVGEADMNLGHYRGPHPAVPTPGVQQLYLALLVQWSFDVRELLRRK